MSKQTLITKKGICQYAVDLDDLKKREVVRLHLDNRPIILVYHNKKVFGLDARCYHAGGPLWKGDVGDIEDIGGVIICPYHGYKITLENGERIYASIGGENKSAGKRQRTHFVKVKKGRVFVRVSTPEEDKDEFNCDRYSTYPI